MINKLLQKIRAKINTSPDAQLKKTTNPYLAARLEWNYLFGDLMKAKKNWCLSTFVLIGTNILLITFLGILSLKSHLVPYVVKEDSLGNALYSGLLDQKKTITSYEVNAFVRQYIINARSVLLDPFAQKSFTEFVYQASLPPVRKLLDSYYRAQNPFQIAKQEFIEIQVQAVIQKSKRTWQVDWLELHRSHEGQILSKSHWEALITIGHYEVKNTEILNTNPLGIFIQDLSWAEQVYSGQ